MFQIILKERAAHYPAIFTREVDQYKRYFIHVTLAALSTPKNTYHELLSFSEYHKVFKNSFFIKHLQ